MKMRARMWLKTRNSLMSWPAMMTWSTITSVCWMIGLSALLVGCKPSSVADSAGPNANSTNTAAGPAHSKDQPGVILLRYTPGSESTHQREEGFLAALNEQSAWPVLSSDQYAGTTPEESLAKAQQMIQKYGPRLAGIFAVCEPNANGTLTALEEASLAGQVRFVGFDPNERMVAALKEGKMHGIVLQDPVTMGNLAVKAMVAHLDPKKILAEDRARLLDGDQVKKRIPTGEYVATPENMNEPRMAQLLNPPQATGSEKAPENAKLRLAVIPKGTTHEFWKSVHYGALQAAEQLGDIEILWQGPPQESDRAEQIKLVQNFITKKVHGIVLAPLDSQALIEVVREARTNGIPTVIFDSGLETSEEDYVSYVATDNLNGGKLAGQRLLESLRPNP
ncbi:MAG: substrate-binding domain-containing protein [Planctomycetota bacterium]